MKVWIAELQFDYEPGMVLGVFSSKEKAEDGAKKFDPGRGDRIVIWEEEIDEYLNKKGKY